MRILSEIFSALARLISAYNAVINIIILRIVDNEVLLNAGLVLMQQSGKSNTRLSSKGRSMFYKMQNVEIFRSRICNDHILIAVAENSLENTGINIEVSCGDCLLNYLLSEILPYSDPIYSQKDPLTLNVHRMPLVRYLYSKPSISVKVELRSPINSVRSRTSARLNIFSPIN
jgi:hypothetical protein